LDLAWRREVVKTGVRALLSGGLLPAERKGLTEIGISRTVSPRWNRARWRLGRSTASHQSEVWEEYVVLAASSLM